MKIMETKNENIETKKIKLLENLTNCKKNVRGDFPRGNYKGLSSHLLLHYF